MSAEHAAYMRSWRAKNRDRQIELQDEQNLRKRAKTILAQRHPHELVAIMRELRAAEKGKK